MYVYMYACIYECVYACMNVCMYHMYVCMYVCMYMNISPKPINAIVKWRKIKFQNKLIEPKMAV